MKKLIVFFSIIFFLFVGCANSSDGSSSRNNDDENGVFEEVTIDTTIENEVILSYSRLELVTGEGYVFTILRSQYNNDFSYTGTISVIRQTTAFSEDYWTNYIISCEQDQITMTGISINTDNNDDYFSFNMGGFISVTSLNQLKNANTLEISLSNSNYPNRNISFTCNNEFILKLRQYF